MRVATGGSTAVACSALTPGFEAALGSCVRGGGSLLVVLGVHSAALPRVPVSNEAIQGSSYASREGDRFQPRQPLDLVEMAVDPGGLPRLRRYISGQLGGAGNVHLSAHLADLRDQRHHPIQFGDGVTVDRELASRRLQHAKFSERSTGQEFHGRRRSSKGYSD